jgi:hypothetical protein
MRHIWRKFKTNWRTLHLHNVFSLQIIQAEGVCQIFGVLRGPKTQVSDHRHHWVHQLAIDAVMGYALGTWCCNLNEIQLSPFCIVG